MDVERTIQFILESQAKAEVRVDAMEKRLDRRMNGIAKLLQQGMRMLVKTDQRLAELADNQKEMGKTLKELAEAQKQTDRTLKAFINSLRNGRNGH